MSTNENTLSRGTRIAKSKKLKKVARVPEVLFDDEKRKEYLTGFSKRKKARINESRKKSEEEAKRAKREMRRDLRDQRKNELKQRMETHAAQFGLDNEKTEDDDIETRKGELWEPVEYDEEDKLVTVTVEAI